MDKADMMYPVGYIRPLPNLVEIGGDLESFVKQNQKQFVNERGSMRFHVVVTRQ